jgi:hypothetical protein
VQCIYRQNYNCQMQWFVLRSNLKKQMVQTIQNYRDNFLFTALFLTLDRTVHISPEFECKVHA